MKIEIDEIKVEISNEDLLNSSGIPRVSCDELSYNQFFHQFMKKNLPVVIAGVNINTEISSKWFEGGELKLEKLEEVLKNHEVPVANCSRQYFDSHEKIQMKFSDFVNYWKGNRVIGNFYLKDFHLKQEFPDLDFYNVPSYFASDWLNEYLIDNGKDDYRFIYIGPKDTWTPFHSDVFGSYSWSANIHGRKLWLLLPPDEELKLKDCLGNLPFSITGALLDEKNVKYFELIQESGETLFVPSKWYHQVCNLDDAVSINHNWFNGCNINHIIDSLINHHKDVEKEISDCKDMENFTEHCQLMLKSSFGMNFNDLLDIITHISDKRTRALKESFNFKMFDEFTFGTKHNLHDLEVITEALTKLRTNQNVVKLKNVVKIIDDSLNKTKGINQVYY